jgi:hypothetical protein
MMREVEPVPVIVCVKEGVGKAVFDKDPVFVRVSDLVSDPEALALEDGVALCVVDFEIVWVGVFVTDFVWEAEAEGVDDAETVGDFVGLTVADAVWELVVDAVNELVAVLEDDGLRITNLIVQLSISPPLYFESSYAQSVQSPVMLWSRNVSSLSLSGITFVPWKS